MTTMDPLGNVTTNIYDANGRQTDVIAELGNTKTLIYDNANRLTGMQYADGTRTTSTKLAMDCAGVILKRAEF